MHAYRALHFATILLWILTITSAFSLVAVSGRQFARALQDRLAAVEREPG